MGQRRALAGFHAVTARLRNGAASVEALYYDSARRDARMHCAKILNDRARMEKAQ